MNIVELYSIKDVSRIFGLSESRLRYWLQSGFLWPSVRRGGRFFYTFQDLVSIRAAKELLDLGVPIQRVRAALDTLRAGLPSDVDPTSRLRVCSDGETLVVVGDDAFWEPTSGQLVMAFAVSSLQDRIAESLAAAPAPIIPLVEPALDAPADDPAAPIAVIVGEKTEPTSTSYQAFLQGLAAEESSDLRIAESCYRKAIELDPSLAAAHTNLGNLWYRRGQHAEARASYERALDLDPLQPEARFNLGNLLGEIGETELAIAELKQVVARAPEFADAHYNLGLLLARVGGVAQARQHLSRYLTLDGASEWADRAREVLAQVSQAATASLEVRV
jgi:tetratricopeptide (TPR) repeat protein